MSEFLQSGLHPDADQLNAFVEHALPAHEREQTLAHLAVCSTCRAVVSLSMPVAEVHRPKPQPARRPWFSGWNMLWPIAAAVATLIPILLYVHQPATRSGGATPTQVAESHAPALPATPASAPPAAAKPPAAPAATAKPAVPSAPPASRTASAPRPGAVAAPPPAPAPAGSASRAVPAANPRQQLETRDATLGSPIENETYSQLPLSMNGGPRDPNTSRANAARPGAGNGNSGIYGGTGQTNLNENYVEGVPVTNIARQGSSNPAADSGGAGSMDAVAQALALADANEAASDDAMESPARLAPLPSGLPTLSTASSGRRTVALDTSNTLFISGDGGRRWRQVSSPWRGRAVKVELASAPQSQLRGYAMNAESGFGGARAGAAAARASSATSGGIQGTITDPSGSVVPGALVTATNTDTGVQTIRRTAADGTYSMRPLPAGPYNIDVIARGFQRQLQENVTVDKASMVGLNLKLVVGGENTTVTDAPPYLDTTDATSAASIATATPSAPAAAKAAPAPTAAAVPTLRAAVRAPAPSAPPPTVAAAPVPSTPLFVITTESGDRWTSVDGQAWTRR